MRAVPGVDAVVLATTDQPADDPFAERLTAARVLVHRGSDHDVLRRVVDAVRPLRPDVVLRQTGDNPFPDPDVMGAQIRRLVTGDFDYVGIDGLPLGIGGEAVRMEALETADREATEPAEREHVLPYLYCASPAVPHRGAHRPAGLAASALHGRHRRRTWRSPGPSPPDCLRTGVQSTSPISRRSWRRHPMSPR